MIHYKFIPFDENPFNGDDVTDVVVTEELEVPVADLLSSTPSPAAASSKVMQYRVSIFFFFESYEFQIILLHYHDLCKINF